MYIEVSQQDNQWATAPIRIGNKRYLMAYSKVTALTTRILRNAKTGNRITNEILEEMHEARHALEENQQEGAQPIWKDQEVTNEFLKEMFADPDAQAEIAEQAELQQAAAQAAQQAAAHAQNLAQTANAAQAATTILLGTQQTTGSQNKESKVSQKLLENPPKSADFKDKKRYIEEVKEWSTLVKEEDSTVQYFLKNKGLNEMEKESTKGAKDLPEFIEKLSIFLLPTQIQQVLNAFSALVQF